MRGDTNFKGSDSSDPTVYSLYCAIGKEIQTILAQNKRNQEIKGK